MISTAAKPIDFPQEVVTWAKSWASQDCEYLRHRAKFGTEPIKSIAKLVLNAAGLKNDFERWAGSG